MTEAGSSGDCILTMQRDRQGRWTPTKRQRGMNIQLAKRIDEASTSGKARNTEPFRSRRPRRAKCMENFNSADGTQTRYLGTTYLPRTECSFRKQFETEWQGVLDFKAVTIIDPTQVDVIREKQCERVISSRFVLRWKETDTGYKTKARWCVHFSRILPYTRLSAVAQHQSYRPSTLHCRS